MRATSHLSISVAVAVVAALVVAAVVDDTKSVVTYLAIFGGIALALGGIAGIVRGERGERP